MARLDAGVVLERGLPVCAAQLPELPHTRKTRRMKIDRSFTCGDEMRARKMLISAEHPPQHPYAAAPR